MKRIICAIFIFVVINFLLTACYFQNEKNVITPNKTIDINNSSTQKTIINNVTDISDPIVLDNGDNNSEIKITTPMTVAVTNLYSINKKSASLRLRMIKGSYSEKWPKTTWKGYFMLELVNDDGIVLSSTDLSKVYETTYIDIAGNKTKEYIDQLYFDYSFKFEFDDYNNDGDIDFTLGQYASSNGRNYKLFTIRKNDEIEELHVKNNPELYITGVDPYSSKLKKIDGTTFKIGYFAPGESSRDDFYKWINNEFVLLKSQTPSDE